MASEKQIAANRRNAQKSTGPKSKGGKKLSSMNALCHGLSVPMSTEGSETQLKKLMRQFAPGASDEGNLALTERAADAQLELARVRWVKNAMIERALTLFAGDAEPCDPTWKKLGTGLPETGGMRLEGAAFPSPSCFIVEAHRPAGKRKKSSSF